MNKVTAPITAVLISILVLTTVSLQAMLTNSTKMPSRRYNPGEYATYLQRNFSVRAEKSEKYNQYNVLITLPDDIFNQIIAYCHTQYNDLSAVTLPRQSTMSVVLRQAQDERGKDWKLYEVETLEKSIKTFMKLSATCKAVHKFLTHETIGKFCKDYAPETKLKMFKKLMQPTYSPGDEIRHLPAIIMLWAGTDSTTIKNELDCLLIHAVRSNDVQRATTLFKYHANPNAQDSTPIFFHANTVEMAQVFIKNKVDLHVIDSWSNTNVLWEVVKTKYPAELMELYLAHQVDAKMRHTSDSSCLLHKLDWSHVNLDDHFFKKVELLLEAIPDMVNTLTQEGETPLDRAYKALKTYHRKNINSETLEAVIALFRKYNGKTAQELQQESL